MINDMKRIIVEVSKFSKVIDNFIVTKRLLQDDFEALKNLLANMPDVGDLISGTNGIRKIRLKSSYAGKSGGFRVYYSRSHDSKENSVDINLCKK